MPHMIAGKLYLEDDVSATKAGEWERTKSTVRHWITPDGTAGPTGESGFAAEAGRYHLFVAWNCPWAHRTLLTRAIKGLEDFLSLSVAKPRRTEQGWVFDTNGTGDFADPLYGLTGVDEVYARDPEPYTGRLTVPVLWDKQRERMVSNESADIVRMLNVAFDGLAEPSIDLYPAPLRDDIDRWNENIYENVNNGVYRAGFATTQEAYERAAGQVFETLNAIDRQLAETRFLTGDAFTEADLRLFPTLARFDVAYHYAFRCNLRRLTDYTHLWPYARSIYQLPGVAPTVHFDIYKQGYFSPSEKRNPLGIVPIGPELPDWDAAHGRG